MAVKDSQCWWMQRNQSELVMTTFGLKNPRFGKKTRGFDALLFPNPVASSFKQQQAGFDFMDVWINTMRWILGLTSGNGDMVHQKTLILMSWIRWWKHHNYTKIIEKHNEIFLEHHDCRYSNFPICHSGILLMQVLDFFFLRQWQLEVHWLFLRQWQLEVHWPCSGIWLEIVIPGIKRLKMLDCFSIPEPWLKILSPWKSPPFWDCVAMYHPFCHTFCFT